MRDRLFDLDHPFFRPLWVRVAVVVVCAAWTVLELVTGSTAWAWVFGGIGVYAAWRFFWRFQPRDEP